MKEILDTLKALSECRPVFHSEADFQHALAWQLQLRNPKSHIRLEKQVAVTGSRVHLDLLLRSSREEVAIELKYKTRLAALSHEGEEYPLRNQSAQDIGRHDFIKDIQRLERYVDEHKDAVGFAVLLTNDPTYWSQSKKLDSVDSQFRIHEGRILSGNFTWGEKASSGTKRNREKPILLQGRYEINWSDYFSFGSKANEKFRFVLVEVSAGESRV